MRTPRPILHLIGCLVLLIPAAAAAQHGPAIELRVGGGYVFGGGSENPGPSLPAYDRAVAVWPFARWGIAARLVRGPGEDLYPAPTPGGDRVFLGQEKLSYYTVGAAYRRFLDAHELNVGFGMLLGGEFRTIVLFPASNGPPVRRSHPDTFFNGFYVEGLYGRQITRYLGIKGGVTFDFNFETSNFQPLALAVLSF